MSHITFSDAVIKAALRRANAEKRKKQKQEQGGRLRNFRPLSYDFARAFVELVRNKYQKLRLSDDPMAFEDVLERMLFALYCLEPDARHGYKKVAGILFEPYSRFAREHNRLKGTVSGKPGTAGHPRSVRSLEGNQFALDLRSGK